MGLNYLLLETLVFEWDVYAYKVKEEGTNGIVLLKMLMNKWPIAMYEIGDDKYITHRYSHYPEYI